MPSVIQQLCDPCFGDDQHVEGQPHVLTVDGVERVLILCAPHEDSVLKPLAELLHEFGAKPAPSEKRTEKRPATPGRRAYTPPSDESLQFGTVPLPNDLTPEAALELLKAGRCIYACTDRTFANKDAVAAHVRTQHHVSLTQLGLGKRGGMVVNPTTSLVCEVCGSGPFQSPRAIGSHRNRTHGIKSTHPSTVQARTRHTTDEQQLSIDEDVPASVTAMRERSALKKSNGKLGCPEAGCDREFQTLPGLNGHRNREHGYKSTTSGAERKRRARAAQKAKSA